MAGKKTTATGEEPTGKAIRVPQVGTMKTYNSAANEVANTIDGAREELKDAGDIAKKAHLFIPAFNVAKGLHDGVKDAKNESIAAEKLAKWLVQFDHARKFFKLDELANLQGRLFPVGPIGSGSDDDAPPRDTDEDGEPDMRPDHLRQPGASVTSAEPSAAQRAVEELAAKAGATPRADDDSLKGVGRGPKGSTPDTKH